MSGKSTDNFLSGLVTQARSPLPRSQFGNQFASDRQILSEGFQNNKPPESASNNTTGARLSQNAAKGIGRVNKNRVEPRSQEITDQAPKSTYFPEDHIKPVKPSNVTLKTTNQSRAAHEPFEPELGKIYDRNEMVDENISDGNNMSQRNELPKSATVNSKVNSAKTHDQKGSKTPEPLQLQKPSWGNKSVKAESVSHNLTASTNLQKHGKIRQEKARNGVHIGTVNVTIAAPLESAEPLRTADPIPSVSLVPSNPIERHKLNRSYVKRY